MKRIHLILFLVFVVLFTGCSSDGKQPEIKQDNNAHTEADSDSENMESSRNDNKKNITASPKYPDSVSYDDYEKNREIKDSNPLDDNFISAVNSFTYKTSSKFLIGNKDNIIYSPLSLYMPLTLLLTGANGNTEEEFRDLLYLKGITMTDKYISTQNGNLMKRLYKNNEIGNIIIANSLWLQSGYEFKDAFIKNATENFYASLHNIDFTDENAVKEIEKWFSEFNDSGFSPLAYTKNTVLSIINTISFKDSWYDKFNAYETKSDKFYTESGQIVECDFMNKQYDEHSYFEGKDYIGASLSFVNSDSMTFILPNEGVSIDNLIDTPEKINSMLTSERALGKVIFSVPKFSFSSQLNLKEKMIELGINSVFDSLGDFSGISNSDIYISSIIQQVKISIDENGAEAKAFTEADIDSLSIPEELEIINMTLNRPFIFVISSNDVVLFIGIVNNPALE